MLHVGCAKASSILTLLKSARSLNGPPLAVRINLLISLSRPACAHCQIALCSESTGIIWLGFARFITKSPPATKDSLLARARVFPASKAASVGPNPIEPVIALRTTSHSIAAIWVDASRPSMTVTPGSASRMTAALSTTPTCVTLNFLACSIINAGFFPVDVRAITRNIAGL